MAIATASALFTGGVALAQPTISSIYPSGAMQFQATNLFSFVATSTNSGGVTSASVLFNGTILLTGQRFIGLATSASGLTISGSTFTTPLLTNCVYSATIVATDSKGSKTNTLTFDTITPAYTWEGEDYDYGGGLYYDNPQTNAYAGAVAVNGQDAYNPNAGGTAYRPINTGGDAGGDLGTEACGDIPRAQYVGTGLTDYDEGWNNGGTGLWGNYTRHFPAGTWNIYMRASGQTAHTLAAPHAYFYQGGIGGTRLGEFLVPYTGNTQIYAWSPLTDIQGNIQPWGSDGSAQTLTAATANGGYNINFFMLLPSPSPSYPDAVLGGIFPDGTYQFQPTNMLTFTINSTLGVSATNVLVQLLSTNLPSTTNTYQLLTAGNGLTVSGDPTSLVVTAPLNSNLVYAAFIQITDANGVITTTSLQFDTITPAYTWEAEDYDYGGGLFIDNPQTNAYVGLIATLGVDAYNPNNGANAYRPVATTGVQGNLGNEVNADVPRLAYMSTGFQDYDQGWNTGGSGLWANYTRTFPTGKWNIYMRGSGDSVATLLTPHAIMYQGGTNGSYLGEFVIPASGAYQSYGWAPLTDVAGNLLEFDGTGSPQTLTIQTSLGGYNANFYMLVPVNPSYKPVPYVTAVTPNNSTMFAWTNTLSFIAHSIPGIYPSNIVVTLNGQPAVNMTIGNATHAVPVTIPIATNTAYQVSIVLKDANGSSTYSTWFGNFQSTDYTWEAEDWDYSGGQYFDTGLNAYSGLSGIEGIDANDSNTSTGHAYRPQGTTGAGTGVGNLGNENNGDIKRAQYVSAGATDYDVGWTAGGQWANYTRHYPAGTYNVYLRASSPNSGGQANAGVMAWVTAGLGTTSQTLSSSLGVFNVPPTGSYQVYTWIPLQSTAGALTTIAPTGSPATLRYTENNGGHNFSFFMLVPQDTARPYISQFYPDGTAMFQATNTWSCVITNSVGIASVTLTINGTVVPASQLTLSGTPTAMVVSYPVLANHVYTGSITAVSVNNDQTTMTIPAFATVSSSCYTFEAEDWDYNGAQFFDNPQIDAYAGLVGTVGIDCYNGSTGVGTSYRPTSTGDLGNQGTGDLARSQYTAAGKADYNIGWTANGNWANYTRTYPAGVYYVFARVAINGAAVNGANLSWVTSGAGSSNQTMSAIGRFNFTPATGGYQIYTWIPLVNSSGSLVTITNTGAAATLRFSELAGGYNLNYFLLAPATPATLKVNLSATASSGNMVISWTPVGGTLMASPALSGPGVDWVPVGTANPATIPMTGTAQFFRVRPF